MIGLWDLGTLHQTFMNCVSNLCVHFDVSKLKRMKHPLLVTYFSEEFSSEVLYIYQIFTDYESKSKTIWKFLYKLNRNILDNITKLFQIRQINGTNIFWHCVLYVMTYFAFHKGETPVLNRILFIQIVFEL